MKADAKSNNEFLLKEVKLLDLNVREEMKILKEKFEAQIGNILTTFDQFKQKQDLVNKKFNTLLTSKFELAGKEAKELLERQWERTEQRVQGSIEFVKHDLVNPVKLDFNLLQKDTEESMNQLQLKVSSELEQVKQNFDSNLQTSNTSWKTTHDSLQTKLFDKILPGLTKDMKHIEGKLADQVQLTNDTLTAKIAKAHTDNDTRWKQTQQTVEGNKQLFYSELKKSSNNLHQQIDFKLDSVVEEMEKVKLSENR
ncbi:unnamed protein product, partial [Amoebophrya sp. A120]|eukprot:GSA120T00024479001.1